MAISAEELEQLLPQTRSFLGFHYDMARALWSSPGNPTNLVSRALGMPRWRLRRAIHRIKRAWGLGGRDRITIWDDGSVTDENGAHLGNIFDEG
jgi:hypothetical protein